MVSEQFQILHYPRLDTVLMVEKFIKENSGEFKKRSLWENLPKKTMYQTYQVIFDYLVDSGKIGVDREGHIAWVWNPAFVKKYLERKDLAWMPSK
ncbi:MAG: hypothetical protein COV47_05680 [Candidatus Diapherotrites archaeon CG11_big_fil_rev_8_21_14_0_20_37_9]|nr:MAG: hypothetical protein COV47_05680 [Candidatus Diapherotrites archaeon CG11_big_fil_rev_8_21_14_0_20_37_9]